MKRGKNANSRRRAWGASVRKAGDGNRHSATLMSLLLPPSSRTAGNSPMSLSRNELAPAQNLEASAAQLVLPQWRRARLNFPDPATAALVMTTTRLYLLPRDPRTANCEEQQRIRGFRPRLTGWQRRRQIPSRTQTTKPLPIPVSIPLLIPPFLPPPNFHPLPVFAANHRFCRRRLS